MQLRELRIHNFRKIEDLTVLFPPGLCVIVGENNAGKTTIIDALRLMLLPGRDYDAVRLNEDDFRRGTEYAPIEISCRFCGLSDEDEVHFLECLVDVGESLFEVQLNMRVTFDRDTYRTNVKVWGGETESGNLASDIYAQIASIYLQPLRDPEKGLRPGLNSQISRLIRCLTSEEQHPEFESIVKEANDRVRALSSIQNAKNDINTQIISISGSELSQTIELIFSDPSFRRIIAGLHPEIDGLPCSLNGLGYNNLIFTAATLGTLQRSPDYSFRSILVEEPEAHLHPQLQVLLLQHFSKVALSNDASVVQVIASSHSPTLVSQAPLDAIISVHQCENRTVAISIGYLEIEDKLKKKLQRFLDVTRGELFFARRILMVEGIAEALLLPVLAKIAGGCLKSSAVTVLNANGINFNAFLPLFGEERLEIPFVILTDGDASGIGQPPSKTAIGLKEKEKEISNLRVKLSERTFEHELARSPHLLPVMLDAFESLHPRKGTQLRKTIDEHLSDDEKANAFFDVFLECKTSKGSFAQELALLLDDSCLQKDVVPAYICEAFEFLGVVPEITLNQEADFAEADQQFTTIVEDVLVDNSAVEVIMPDLEEVGFKVSVMPVTPPTLHNEQP